MDLSPTLRKAVIASRKLRLLNSEETDRILLRIAEAAVVNTDFIVLENLHDLALMEQSDPRFDRLLLNKQRISAIASDIRTIAALPSPLKIKQKEVIRPNGLKITKVSVPFGVIGIIYEARPNVTFDVFSLCFKSGNACILKGGSDAFNSNKAIAGVIRKVLESSDVDPDVLLLLGPGREETDELLKAREYVDLLIPRGSRSLIDYVRCNSLIPVIETGAGICHTYFDESGDREKARMIVHNAKTRRVSVCNALDCLIIHSGRLADLPYITGLCADNEVVIYADDRAFEALRGSYPDELLKRATEDSYGTEFLAYKMAVRSVDSFEEALGHISMYGSKHSEAIITEDTLRASQFFALVDAAALYSNTSTAFTDGGEFGLGAEIGISTQKLHARGPMGLEALTTYKWIIEGDGQIRSNN